MAGSLRELGGKEWERLGLPEHAPTVPDGEQLSWAGLLPMLTAQPTSPDELLRLALVQLDVLDDPAKCGALLQQVGDNAQADWVALRLAMRQGPEALRAWAGQQDDLVGRALCQLVCEAGAGREAVAMPPPDLPQPAPSEALRWAGQLLLGRHAQWASLARELEQEGGGAAWLVAADLWGALGQREDRLRLLRAAQETEGSDPALALLGCEALLDTAQDSGPQELAATLALRREVMATMPELGPEMAATALLEACILRQRPAQEADGIGGDAAGQGATARAWRQLCALQHRVAGAALPQWYAERAQDCPEALCPVVMLRRLQLAVEQREWSAVLESLEHPALAQPGPGLASLVDRYRCLALGALGRWAELAQLALERGTEVESERLQGHWLTLALALGGDASAALELLVEGLGRQPEVPWIQLATALLLREESPVAAGEPVARLVAEVGVDAASLLGPSGRFAAALLLLRAGAHEAALEAFDQDLAREGGILAEAGRLLALSGQQDWGGLVAALEQIAGRVGDAYAALLLREAAHLAAIRTNEPERASQLLGRALALTRQGREDVLVEQAALALRRGQLPDVSAALGQAAAELEGAARADLLCARGIVEQELIGDAEQAEACFREAIAVHPLHFRTLHGLYNLLVKQRRYRDMPDVLDSLLHLTNTDAGRVKLLNNLGTLYRKLWRSDGLAEDADRCIEHCDAALALEPDNQVATTNLILVCEGLGRPEEIVKRFTDGPETLVVLRALARALRDTHRYPESAQAYTRLAEVADDGVEGARAAAAAGDLLARELGQLEHAAESFSLSLRLHATVEVVERLTGIYRELDQPRPLAETLEQALSLLDDDAAVEAHVELGQLYAQRLDNQEAAIRHYEAALAQRPEEPAILDPLEAALEATGNLAGLARLLERRLQLAPGGKTDLRALRRLVEVSHELGRGDTTLRLLGLLHKDFLDRDEVMPLSVRVLTDLGRQQDLCHLIERRVQLLEAKAGSETERAELLRQKGNLELTHLGQTSAAVDSLLRAQELMPGDVETFGLLRRILSETEDWQRLLAMHETRANRLPSPREKVEALHAAAHVALHRLGDEAETVRLYERIHAIDPSDAESFAYLESKLSRLKDDRRLADLLEARAGTMDSPQDAVRCLLRAGAVREKVGDAAQARATYRRVLEIDGGSARAMRALSRIAEALESWDEFLDVTKRQIEVTQKPTTRALLFFKLGSVLETKYQREEEAIRNYEQAIRVSATCLPALHSLRDLYSRREDWPRVVETLKTESQVWTDRKGKAGVLAQIADLYANKLGDHAEAFRYYRDALQNHPENMRAAAALFDAYRNQGSYADAAAWGEVYARQVRHRGSKAQRAEFYVRWAAVLRRIERFEEAADFLVQAQELRSDDTEILHGLLDLCRVAPEAYDFSSIFERLLKDASRLGNQDAVAVLLTASGVLAEQAGDVSRALQLYGEALDKAGPSIRLARPMADLLVLLGRESEALELVQRCRNTARDESFARWIEATQWLVEHETLWRGDFRKAVAWCEEALEEQPNRDDVRLLLAQALMMEQRPQQAEVEYRRICDKLAKHGLDLQLLAQRYHSMGLAAEQAGNLQRAESSWHRASELAPELPYPPVALARVHAARDDYPTALALLERADGEHPDMLRARALLAERMGHGDAAYEQLKTLAGAKGASVEDRLLLARHMARQGDAAGAMQILRELLAAEGDYLPALELLRGVAEAAGESGVARRGAQVLYLALGAAPPPEPVAVRAPIQKAVWGRLARTEIVGAMASLWGLTRESLTGFHDQVEQGAGSSPATNPELAVAQRQVEALFGEQLELGQLRGTAGEFQLSGTRLLVRPDLSTVTRAEARMLLTTGLAWDKLGYAILLRMEPAVRRVAARRLAEVLTGPAREFTKAAALVAAQPWGRQRQVSRLAAQNRIPVDAVDDVARSWLAQVERRTTVIALAITEDLAGYATLHARRVGLQSHELGQGGLLGAVPQLWELAQVYVSSDFASLREQLGGGAAALAG